MNINIFVVLFFLVSMIFGCATTLPIPPAPTAENQFVNLPFKKTINPVWEDECTNKWVIVQVRFRSVENMVMDLPSEYQEGYVRFDVYDPIDSSARFNNVVIPKGKSDLLFKLKRDDKIELYAYLIPGPKLKAITNRPQSNLLFLVDHIKKVD